MRLDLRLGLVLSKVASMDIHTVNLCMAHASSVTATGYCLVAGLNYLSCDGLVSLKGMG